VTPADVQSYLPQRRAVDSARRFYAEQEVIA